jgi:hypothetical protein
MNEETNRNSLSPSPSPPPSLSLSLWCLVRQAWHEREQQLLPSKRRVKNGMLQLSAQAQKRKTSKNRQIRASRQTNKRMSGLQANKHTSSLVTNGSLEQISSIKPAGTEMIHPEDLRATDLCTVWNRWAERQGIKGWVVWRGMRRNEARHGDICGLGPCRRWGRARVSLDDVCLA